MTLPEFLATARNGIPSSMTPLVASKSLEPKGGSAEARRRFNSLDRTYPITSAGLSPRHLSTRGTPRDQFRCADSSAGDTLTCLTATRVTAPMHRPSCTALALGQHGAAQNRVHAGLVALPPSLKPGQHIGIEAGGDLALDRPI